MGYSRAMELKDLDNLDLTKPFEDVDNLDKGISLSAFDKKLVEKYINFRGYRGDQQLKRAGVQIEWTPELLNEYKKCAEDPVYFLENYMKIINLDEGLILFKLRSYQKQLINNMHNYRNSITVMARQSGKSTAVVGYLLWYILFNNYKTVLLLANNADTAREILGKAQIAYLALPKFIQQGIVDGGWNKGSMVLENGSKAVAMASSDAAARGYATNILILDETAHIEHWEEFSASTLPTVSAGKTSKIFMISTPFGLNHFYTYWERAKLMNIPKEDWPNGMAWNGYVPLFVRWSDVPGRDQQWLEETMMQLNGDQQKFDQEFNCEFMGSSGTLIAGWKLKTLMPKNYLTAHEGVKKYINPIEGHTYAITADVSEGKKLNYSAFHVTDISQMPYQQVCTYRSNNITPGDFAELLVLTAEAYNHACILIEYMSLGPLVSKDIWETFEYDNILFTKTNGREGRIITHRVEKGADLGLKMTEISKKNGCLWLKLLIEQDGYIIRDADTIKEFQRFSKVNNTYKAEEGATDDMVMALVVFAWLSHQDYFRNLTNIDTMKGLREKQAKDIEENMSVLGLMFWKEEQFLPNTAEMLGLVKEQDLWGAAYHQTPMEHSPYVRKEANWMDGFKNPYEQGDDWDRDNLLPNF